MSDEIKGLYPVQRVLRAGESSSAFKATRRYRSPYLDSQPVVSEEQVGLTTHHSLQQGYCTSPPVCACRSVIGPRSSGVPQVLKRSGTPLPRIDSNKVLSFPMYANMHLTP